MLHKSIATRVARAHATWRGAIRRLIAAHSTATASNTNAMERSDPRMTFPWLAVARSVTRATVEVGCPAAENPEAMESAIAVGSPAARKTPIATIAPAHANRYRLGIVAAATNTRSVPSAANTASENIVTYIIVLGARKNLVPGTIA